MKKKLITDVIIDHNFIIWAFLLSLLLLLERWVSITKWTKEEKYLLIIVFILNNTHNNCTKDIS